MKKSFPDLDFKSLDILISHVNRLLTWQGYSQSTFFEYTENEVQFLIKLNFVHKSRTEMLGKTNTISQTLCELRMLRALKERVIRRGKSPCILELLYDKTRKVTDLALPLAEGDKLLRGPDRGPERDSGSTIKLIFHSEVDFVRAGLAHDCCVFLVLERCDYTFRELLSSQYSPATAAIVKSVIFKVLHALYVIKKIYPSFSHNDLHTSNIMIKVDRSYEFDSSRPRYDIFRAGKKKYALPYFGITPKIIDFGFAVAEEEGIVSNVTDEKLMMHRALPDNITLLSNIYWDVRSNVDMNAALAPILDALDPTGTYLHMRADVMSRAGVKVATAGEMLACSIFSEYLRSPPESQILRFYE